MTTTRPTLILAGASVRAVAASALRAGFAPWCVDLFADADLQRDCPVRRIEMVNYPEGLVAALAEAPPGPWLYTGALENRSDVVGQVPRPLWGNPPDVLRRVRSPRQVRACLMRHGLPCPEIASAEPDPRRAWLVKPFHSAGGQSIRPWRHGTMPDAKRFYLQEHIEGECHAAIYLGQFDGAATLLGVTRQLVGEPWLHAAAFQYCGSVGPVTPTAATRLALEKLGNVLTTEFGLRGLFGVDLIMRDDEPWPVEINPRYTASVEILERATNQAFLVDHANVFGTGSTVQSELNVAARATCWAKAIAFAPCRMTIPTPPPWPDAPLPDLAASFADVPHPGDIIEAGHPICTAFASGATPDESYFGVRRLVAALGFLDDASR